MNDPLSHRADPRLDLVFERIVAVPPQVIWQAWTTPEILKQWFTPAPWQTIDCEIDLRPGGIFHTIMRSPDGQETSNIGCFLEIVENERLAWTNALEPGFRPRRTAEGTSCTDFFITAIITLRTEATATRYTALVLHGEEQARGRHEKMGFQEGWGTAFDQLVEVVSRL